MGNIEDQVDGLLLLAPFIVGATSLVAALLYRNYEAVLTLWLQVSLLGQLRYLVRPHHELDEFYNEEEQDMVQIVQLWLWPVTSGLIGMAGTIFAVGLLFQQKIPTPIEYFLSLYHHVLVVGKDH